MPTQQPKTVPVEDTEEYAPGFQQQKEQSFQLFSNILYSKIMKHIANSREYTYNFVMGEFFVVSL